MSPNYEKRMLRVLDYIRDNPAGDLSLDKLAEVAAMSRFHWHRVFREITGETCAQTIRRIRMFRAANMLVQTDKTVAEIAALVGYDNVQSFGRSFRGAFGKTPVVFRQSSDLAGDQTSPQSPADPPLKKGTYSMFPVNVTEAPRRRLATLPRVGPYQEGDTNYGKLFTILGASGQMQHALGVVGIYYDDPEVVPAAELRSAACMIMNDAAEIPPELTEMILPAGRVIVLRHKGPYAGLAAAYKYLYGEWIPSHDYELADQPCFEIYLNDASKTPPNELLTEICVPIC